MRATSIGSSTAKSTAGHDERRALEQQQLQVRQAEARARAEAVRRAWAAKARAGAVQATGDGGDVRLVA